MNKQEPGGPTSDPAPNAYAQPLLTSLSDQKTLALSDMRCILISPGNPKEDKIPDSKAQNAAMHAIILDGVTDKQAMHCKSQSVWSFSQQDWYSDLLWCQW